MGFQKNKKKESEKKKPENPAFQTITIEVEKEHQRMDPKQFMLWVFLGSIAILFTGLLVAHIIIYAQGKEELTGIPVIFYFSTLVILLSSVMLNLAQRSMKEDEIHPMIKRLMLTLLLGIVFLVSQTLGWFSLLNQELYLTSGHSVAFLYLLSGLHALHILGGVIYLGVVINKARNYQIHSRNQKSLLNCSTYWHFVDGLWVYVLVVLLIF